MTLGRDVEIESEEKDRLADADELGAPAGRVSCCYKPSLAERLTTITISHLLNAMVSPYISPIVDSTSVFKTDIFKGKVLFCTGGGSGICKGMTESVVGHRLGQLCSM